MYENVLCAVFYCTAHIAYCTMYMCTYSTCIAHLIIISLIYMSDNISPKTPKPPTRKKFTNVEVEKNMK